jgi:hypothetical protein
VKPKTYGPYTRDLVETMGGNEAWNFLHPKNNVEYEVIPE